MCHSDLISERRLQWLLSVSRTAGMLSIEDLKSGCRYLRISSHYFQTLVKRDFQGQTAQLVDEYVE
jgi:hypothetical protein